MTTQPAIQFAEAVARTIQGVAHLYRELDHLNESLLNALKADPDPLRFLIGTPLESSNRDELDRHIRDQYHFLLEPGAAVDRDVEEDTPEDSDESDTEDEVTDRRVSHKAILQPPQPCLALSVILHDPRQPMQEPHVRYLVIRDWGLGATGKAPKEGTITVARHLAIRMLRKLDLSGDLDSKRRILTAAKAQGRGGRHAESLISARVPLPPRTVPLFQLEGVEAIQSLARDIKAYWSEALVTTEL